MPGSKKEAPSVESAVLWLEEELRQTKTQLRKAEHQVEQAASQAWEMGNTLRKAEETLAGLTTAVAAFPALQEELRQVKEMLSRIQDRQSQVVNRAEEAVRQRQADLERERQERGGLSKRLDAVEKVVDKYETRAQAIEEVARHLEEELANLHQGQVSLTRHLQELALKAGRNLEAINRLEHALDRLGAELESMHKQDELLAERINLQEQGLRRGEERLDQLERYLELPQDIKVQQDRARFEREQLSERVAALERLAEEIGERSKAYGHGISLMDQRTQSQASRLLVLAQELQDYGQQVGDQLRKVMQVLERQKRRQAEALHQEIKELKQSDLNHPSD